MARWTTEQVLKLAPDDKAAKAARGLAGALDRATRARRPRHYDIDWDRTIRANLRHYQPELRTVIPERLVGFGRRNPEIQRDIVLCIDQSGSMASSVVYSSIFAAVLASMRRCGPGWWSSTRRWSTSPT